MLPQCHIKEPKRCHRNNQICCEWWDCYLIWGMNRGHMEASDAADKILNLEMWILLQNIEFGNGNIFVKYWIWECEYSFKMLNLGMWKLL